MANYENENEFTKEIRKIEEDDLVHADIVNYILGKFFNNTMDNRKQIEHLNCRKADLAENGKVLLSQIPDAILGQMVHAGEFNVMTSTASLTTFGKDFLGIENDEITLTNDETEITGYISNQGNYFVCATGGKFAGITFQIGDWLVANATGWAIITNTDLVLMVNGKIGAVELDALDINATLTDATASTTLPTTTTGTVQSFLQGLRNNIKALLSYFTSGVLKIANGGTGATSVSAAKSNLGLGNVDNTRDADKSVNYAASAGIAVMDSYQNNIMLTYAAELILNGDALVLKNKAGGVLSTITTATTSDTGLMSASDKTNLNILVIKYNALEMASLNKIVQGTVVLNGVTSTLVTSGVYSLIIPYTSIHSELSSAFGQGLFLQNGDPSVGAFKIIGYDMSVSGQLRVCINRSISGSIRFNYRFNRL